MPEKEIAAPGAAKRWRTVKLPDGRTVKVAIVKKAGAPKPAAGGPEDLRNAAKRKGK